MTTPPEEPAEGAAEEPEAELIDRDQLLPYDGDATSDEEVRAILGRIEKCMLGWAAVALLAWLVLVRSLDGVAILTLGAAASIVSFRGLQRLVWGLGVRDGGKLDRRSQVSAGIRFSIILLLPAASLWLDSRQAFALIVGFSALPLALMTEGVIQLFTKRRSD